MLNTNFVRMVGGDKEIASMSIGGVDPIKLVERMLNLLLQKGLITQAEGQAVIDHSKS